MKKLENKTLDTERELAAMDELEEMREQQLKRNAMSEDDVLARRAEDRIKHQKEVAEVRLPRTHPHIYCAC